MQLGSNQPSATINVTPLIDVLLVLLIIFMVVLPTRSVGLEVQVPQQDSNATPSRAQELALVITVRDDGGADLNREHWKAGEWHARLRTLLASRADRTVFFTAEPDLEFRLLGEAIDAARAAGAKQVGLLAKPK